MFKTIKPILTIPRYFVFAKIFMMGLAINEPIYGISHELSRCGRALHMAAQGKFEGTIKPQYCPHTARIIQWLQLQNPLVCDKVPSNQAFEFLQKNPHWPLRERLQSQAEENLQEGENSQLIRQWFADNPPVTAKGATYYARALVKAGKKNSAKKIVQNAWINFDFDGAHLKAFWKEFKEYLIQEDHQRRVDRLLMREKIEAARIMFPWLSDGHKALADARIALIQLAGDVDSKLQEVPHELSTDLGLIYDRIKWHRRKENNTSMMKFFEETEAPHQDADLWWKERNILIRRLMDERRFQDAYNVAKGHGLSEGENFATGEWLAGWIALRMLKRPRIALEHFRTLLAKVKTPISTSRAAYWAARAASVVGNQEEAQILMTQAKHYPGTYYGQLAIRGTVTGSTPYLHSKRPVIDQNARKKFEEREFVQIIRIMCAAGAKHLVEPFGVKLCQELTNPGEQFLLIELASIECGPYYGVLASKKLPMKNVPLIEAAFPILPRHYQSYVKKVSPALVHAIIRQESRFKADAISPAGAQGLMQLMPKTALQTAKKTKARMGSLSDPNVNIPLGCAHLKELIKQYNGSLILTIAAYNAGVKAVESWIQQYGDPRKPGVDLIDWIELIPYAETRNYVQRVWENYAYYSQKLKM